jgi:hypothetical protein
MLVCARMRTRPLRKDEDENDNTPCENARGDIATDLQSAVSVRFVQQIPERCTKRSRSNERGPK